MEWRDDDIVGIFEAAGNGDIEEVRELLESGVNPNIRDVFGFTPILLAIDNGHVDTVELLLNAGANLNRRDNLGYTVIDQALRFHLNDDMIELLRHHISSTIIQSRFRGERARRKIETQRDRGVFDSPSPPDMDQWRDEAAREIQRIRNEAARNIQRRIKGRQTRRKLTKRSPRYGKWATPTTEREKMRRWIELTKMYSGDDPMRGYEQFSIYPERLLPGQKERMREEEENKRMAQYGGRRRRQKKTMRKRNKYKFY